MKKLQKLKYALFSVTVLFVSVAAWLVYTIVQNHNTLIKLRRTLFSNAEQIRTAMFVKACFVLILMYATVYSILILCALLSHIREKKKQKALQT